MSKASRARRGCMKVAYPTETAALLEMGVLRQKRADRGDAVVECRAYEHEECGKWHLTSRPNPPASSA